MRANNQATFISWRFYLLIIFILFIVAGLIARMVDLTILKRHFLLKQGEARSLRIVHNPAFRGMIMDREGYPLAISTSVYSIWANPKEALITSDQVRQLATTLNLKDSFLKKLLTQYKNKNREFVYIKRDVSPQIAMKIKQLRISGVYEQQEYKRFYPEGEVAAHVVGFTNVDDQGQEGLELAYNQWLSGTIGKKKVIKDRLGRIISEVENIQQQKPGNDLILSINRQIQYLAYRALLEGIQANLAASGSIVVLDVKTGEILAMVNQPSYNPNNRTKVNSDALRNRVVTDLFEPGSTIKAFSVATALASGLYKPETVIDTYPGWVNIGHHIIKDEHRKGPMTITEILQYSSNVGISKMILTLQPEQLWKLLHKMGFGEETGIRFPGERSGVLIKRDKWPSFAIATLAIGYGLSITPLQLAHAYATLANEGVKIPLSVLKVNEAPKGERVMDPQIARQLLNLLQSVLSKGGTAEDASIPGYHIAGKTGTSKIVGANGYEKHRYVSSFVGIAPVSQPRLVVAVIVRDPQGKQYYGGKVSGPIFKAVMEGALRILNIPPDNISAEKPS